MVPSEALTRFQREIITAFFSLPESRGYVLAGGAALLAAGLSTRPTEDVDIFGSDLAAGVGAAADAFEALCADRSWRLRRLQQAPTIRDAPRPLVERCSGMTADDRDVVAMSWHPPGSSGR